jgi:hypothetical protein
MGSGEKRRCDARTTEWDCGAKRLQRDPAPRFEINRIKDADDDAGVDTLTVADVRESKDGRW